MIIKTNRLKFYRQSKKKSSSSGINIVITIQFDHCFSINIKILILGY